MFLTELFLNSMFTLFQKIFFKEKISNGIHSEARNKSVRPLDTQAYS